MKFPNETECSDESADYTHLALLRRAGFHKPNYIPDYSKNNNDPQSTSLVIIVVLPLEAAF